MASKDHTNFKLQIAIVSAILLYWFFVKIELFQSLSYVGDLFVNIQASTSLISGKTLFYDSVFAPNSYVHNHYLLILISPIVLIMGAYGLFITHLMLLFICFYKWLFLFSNKANNYLPSLLVALIIILGPISFWMWDDPSYGWHVELLFFPIGLLFGMSLFQEKFKQIFWGILLVLIREDGAILACCLHLVKTISEAENLSNFLNFKFIKKSMLIVCFWIIIFTSGLLIIKIFATHGSNRQDLAINNFISLFSNTHNKNIILKMLSGTLALSVAPIILFFYKIKIRFLFITILCSVPALLATTLATTAYLPNEINTISHGTSWPTRFSILWAIISFGIFVALYKNKKILNTKIIFLICMTSLIIQTYSLNYTRDYIFLEKILPNKNLLPISKISPKSKNMLSCISKNIETKHTLVISGSFGAFFHKHDWVFGTNIKNHTNKPDIYICDRYNKLIFDISCREKSNSTKKKKHHTFLIDDLQITVRKKETDLMLNTKKCITNSTQSEYN